MAIRIPPSLGACPTYWVDNCFVPVRPPCDQSVLVTGHFNDPRSATCTATWTGTGPKPASFTPAYVKKYCRTQFVMDTKPVRTLVLPVNPN